LRILLYNEKLKKKTISYGINEAYLQVAIIVSTD